MATSSVGTVFRLNSYGSRNFFKLHHIFDLIIGDMTLNDFAEDLQHCHTMVCMSCRAGSYHSTKISGHYCVNGGTTNTDFGIRIFGIESTGTHRTHLATSRICSDRTCFHVYGSVKNNWSGGNYVIRSADDVSHYFIVYNWDEAPVVYLVKRNSQGAEEIAEIELPNGLRRRFLASVGHNKGVYALEGEVREWLEHQLLN
jgi:hypothetical protein